MPLDTARAAHTTPASIEAVDELIRRIGDMQIRRDEITDEADRDAAKTIRLALVRARKIDREIKRMAEALRLYAQANRSEFVSDGKFKLRTCPSGKLGWKRAPKAVVLGKQSEEALIAKAIAEKHPEFTRTKIELDRQTIIKHPRIAARVLGVKVQGDQQFVIAPTASPSRTVKSSRRRRWEHVRPRKRKPL